MKRIILGIFKIYQNLIFKKLMGAKPTNNSNILFSLIYDIYKEINSFNEKFDLGIDKIIDTLEFFFLSDKFIPFVAYESTEKAKIIEIILS